MIWYAQLLLLAPTLFDQSIVHLLQRNFPKTQFLLVKLFSALSGSALDLPNAIAESCNSYFLQLNAAAIPEQVRAMPARFHLPDPRDFTPENLPALARNGRSVHAGLRQHTRLSHRTNRLSAFVKACG